MIIGKSVCLRAVETKDIETLLSWRNIDSFRKNFREFRELNFNQQVDWFKGVSSSKNDFMFAIIDINTDELIGACGLLYIDWINRSADYSFYIGKDQLYIDDIYAKDASNLLLSYGFNKLNLNKIWMELYEFDNMKIDFFTNEFNFEVDGKLRQNCFEDGKYYDSFIISLLQSDFTLNNEKKGVQE